MYNPPFVLPLGLLANLYVSSWVVEFPYTATMCPHLSCVTPEWRTTHAVLHEFTNIARGIAGNTMYMKLGNTMSPHLSCVTPEWHAALRCSGLHTLHSLHCPTRIVEKPINLKLGDGFAFLIQRVRTCHA